MRNLRGALVLLVVVGCSGDTSLPTDPVPPSGNGSPRFGSVSGNVYAEYEQNCAADAFVEVLDGPKAGLRVQQDYDVCVAEGNGWTSFMISDLPFAQDVKIRASAPGYVSHEITANTSSGVPIRFVLAKQ